MSCFCPPQFAHLKWHTLVCVYDGDDIKARVYERAEWVPDNGSGIPIWNRWGYCGDFADLCHAIYVEPHSDQRSTYEQQPGRVFVIDPRPNPVVDMSTA